MKKNDLIKLKAALVAAGVNGMLVKSTDAQELVTAGLAEVNTAAGIDANGLVPTRATQALLGETATAPVAAAKPKFVIMSGIVPVAGVRGGVREEVYPFSQLEVGQSFVVPVNAGETSVDVVKRFSSTVSSATRRYATASTTDFRTNKKGESIAKNVPTRKFTLRPVNAGDSTVVPGYLEPESGARVFRTA